MSEAFKRAGILYGKLGLSTPASLIEGRYPGIERAAKDLTKEKLPELLLALFGRNSASDVGFLEHFRTDPTFDVQPGDKEAALLATAIVDYAMTEGSKVAGEIALLITTAAMGGMRPPIIPSEILSIADATLTAKQSAWQEPPSRRNKPSVPDELTNAIQSLKGTPFNQNNISGIGGLVTSLAEALVAYTGLVSQQANTSNNALIAHIAKLEEETRTHWWVVGGWSTEENSAFKDLDLISAAVLAGWELADKTESSVGLHAAPALLNLVLERGRNKRTDATLAIVAKTLKLDWRKNNFDQISNGDSSTLTPIFTMFGLSAESNDEDDWKPAFKRKIGLDSAITISPLALATQVYRECLALRLLEA